MKKIALSGLFILVFIAYIFYQQNGKNEFDSDDDVIPVQRSQHSRTVTPQQPSLSLIDGEYTSSVGDAFFGPLQIKAVASGGKTSDIQFLTYPNDRPTSVQINEQAMPILKEEVITAQNSKVDVVTGATQTSDAFILLMQEVLQKAKA